MPDPGPVITITEMVNGRSKILVITTLAGVFSDSELRDSICHVQEVNYFLLGQQVTANDSNVAVLLHAGVEPRLAAEAIAQVIAKHNQWDDYQLSFEPFDPKTPARWLGGAPTR